MVSHDDEWLALGLAADEYHVQRVAQHLDGFSAQLARQVEHLNVQIVDDGAGVVMYGAECHHAVCILTAGGQSAALRVVAGESAPGLVGEYQLLGRIGTGVVDVAASGQDYLKVANPHIAVEDDGSVVVLHHVALQGFDACESFIGAHGSLCGHTNPCAGIRGDGLWPVGRIDFVADDLERVGLVEADLHHLSRLDGRIGIRPLSVFVGQCGGLVHVDFVDVTAQDVE